MQVMYLARGVFVSKKQGSSSCGRPLFGYQISPRSSFLLPDMIDSLCLTMRRIQMGYEVTATRKRPQLFDALVGQEFVVSTIKSSLEQMRFAHAYLFSGPRGVGKTSSARILAKALNCEQGPTPYPCGVCSSCREITAGNSTDVIEIDGASNTSVNDVRIIKDEVLFPPQSSRYKIYIIDEVHMLSTSAFNALLKTIEEPPEYVLFIFATTETHKVPATIRSRCQQFHFQLISLESIKEVLAQTVSEMGIEAEDEALFWIAKESTGSMRDAYTLFDQIVSFSGEKITMEGILKKMGISGIDSIQNIVSLVGSGQTDEGLSRMNDLMISGVSVEQAVKDFASFFRALLLIQRGITNESVLGIQPSSISSTLLELYSEEQLEAALQLFLQLFKDIRYSLEPRYELELALSRLSYLHQMASSMTLVRQIRELKESILSGNPPQAHPAQPPVQPRQVPQREKPAQSAPLQRSIPQKPQHTPPPTPPQTAPARKVVEKITQDTLVDLIHVMAQKRDPLGNLFHQVSHVEHEENRLTLTFANQYSLDHGKEHVEKFRKLFNEECGFDGKLVFTVETPKEAHTAKTDGVDPTLKQIASMFRGKIVQ